MFLRVFAGHDPMRGYQCAHITLSSFFNGLVEFIPTPFARHLDDATLDVFVGASGLINPLLILYLFFKPARRIPVLVTFGILLVEAIAVFVVFRTVPGIGFFMWAAGTILIVAAPYKREGTLPVVVLETR